MSNLTPTPRMDKNGTIVVRHMKPQSTPAPSSLPSPTLAPMVTKIDVSGERESSPRAASREGSNPIARWVNERQRTKITDRLVGELFDHGREVHRYTNRSFFTDAVWNALSMEEVKLALAVTSTVTRSEVPEEIADRDRTAVINAIEPVISDGRSGERVRSLHTHMDWLKSRPGEAWKLNKVSDTLRQYRIEHTDSGGMIQHIDAYVRASLHPMFLSILPSLRMDFLISATKHPEAIDQLATYVKERETVDEAGFAQYLSTAAPLAGGTL